MHGGARQADHPDVDVADISALLGAWAISGHGPLHRRLAHALRRLIDSGVLGSNSRLPPERLLAPALAVSRNTVTKALDELRSEGRLISRQGSGTFVVGSPARGVDGARVATHLSSGSGIDLAKGDAPDLSHLPAVSIEAWHLEATCGGAAVTTGGLPELQAAVADLYARGGITGQPRHTGSEEVHVTAGSHQASYLLVSTLVPLGGAVAVAELSYPGIFDILEGCGVRPIPVKIDSAGMVPESLERVISRERPDALYFQAGPQIPTGRVTSKARMRSLASIVDRHCLTVIEDSTLAAMAFDGGVRMLADLCRETTVVSTGSLSKVCFSGLRLGWIRGPISVINATVHRRFSTDLGASVPSQLLALQLLPHLEGIAAERRARLEALVDDALAELGGLMPEAVIERPDGGSILWVRLPADDSTSLVELARRRGVRVAPGSIHRADKAPGPFIRIDVDRSPEVVRAGLERLAAAWQELRRSRAAASRSTA